jgi:hypothetical protein
LGNSFTGGNLGIAYAQGKEHLVRLKVPLQLAVKKNHDTTGTRSMMLALVDQWHHSGLSQVEFAKVHNMRTVKLR